VNAPLEIGCAAGGLVIGAVLTRLARAVPPANRPDEPAPGPVPAGTERHSPAAEIAGGVTLAVLFAAAARHFGAVPVLAPFCTFFAGLLAMSVVDLRVQLVPKRMLYPTLVLTAGGLLAASALGPSWTNLWHAALCGVGAFVVFYALWFAYPKGMGFGDVRLAGLIGGALGWIGPRQMYVGFVSAFALGVLFGVVTLLVRGGGRRARFAFGPALSGGAVVAVFWGTTLVNGWFPHGA
jgi:leader peptidase (prepilin peptidase)/N-methyltransferase